MNAKEIGTYIGNGFDKAKEVILAAFGKSADAYNDYDVVVNVTEHGKGHFAEPTGSRLYHRKYRLYVGNAVLVALGVISAVAIAVGVYSLIDNVKN